LKEKTPYRILSYVESVGDIKTHKDFNAVTSEAIEANIVRCPDEEIAKQMISLIASFDMMEFYRGCYFVE